MAIPSPHCKLTAESIKSATGQFDLESIFKLAMSHMSIRVIENLALCPNLTVRRAPNPSPATRVQYAQAHARAAAAASRRSSISPTTTSAR